MSKKAQSPYPSKHVAALAEFYGSAPPQLHPYLDNAISEFIASTVPRLGALVHLGAGLAREELDSLKLGEAFVETLDEARKSGAKLPSEITATIVEIGREIGEAIDKAIPRALLTARNEQYVNRDAHLDIVAGHALVVRGLSGLDTVPTDYAPADNDGS